MHLRRILPLLTVLSLTACRAQGGDGGMDPLVKDWVDVLANAGGLLAIALAVETFRRETRKHREQRENEAREQRAAEEQRRRQREAELEQRDRQLTQDAAAEQQRVAEWRWRKAELARELLDQLHANELAVNAMRMLDWERRDYTLPGGQTVALERPALLAALRTDNERFTPAEMFVRDCFDEFFGVMERVQHYLEIELVELTDVQYPFRYYVGRMERHPAEYRGYLHRYGFRRALRLWDVLANTDDHIYGDIHAGRETVREDRRAGEEVGG